MTDIWGEKFPDSKKYTWSNKDGSRRSHIDFWLVSKTLNKDSIAVDILTTPLKDHRAVTISINFFPGEDGLKSFSYWKMNSSLLNHSCVKLELERLITLYWNKAQREGLFWN